MTAASDRENAKGKTVSRGARHRAKPATAAYEAHKGSWDAKRPLRLRPFHQEPWYLDGRKLRRYCAEMAIVTGDDRFEAFGRVLEEHGLHEGTPRQQSDAYILSRRFLDVPVAALEEIAMAEQNAAAIGAEFSVNMEAARLVDAYNLPGKSFGSTVDDLRKQFAALPDEYRRVPRRSGKKT